MADSTQLRAMLPRCLLLLELRMLAAKQKQNQHRHLHWWHTPEQSLRVRPICRACNVVHCTAARWCCCSSQGSEAPWCGCCSQTKRNRHIGGLKWLYSTDCCMQQCMVLCAAHSCVALQSFAVLRMRSDIVSCAMVARYMTPHRL